MPSSKRRGCRPFIGNNKFCLKILIAKDVPKSQLKIGIEVGIGVKEEIPCLFKDSPGLLNYFKNICIIIISEE
jgi:hypothetical protein